MKRMIFAAAALAALGGCVEGATQRDEANRRALAEAREVGEPADCITIASIDYSRVRDDRTIDFYMRGGEVYRNRLRHECPGLAFDDSFSYATSLSRLCSVDTITVNSNSGGAAGRTCGLGAFQRIETNVR